jgi:hypothetical protein
MDDTIMEMAVGVTFTSQQASSDLLLSKPNATMNVESNVMTNICDVKCIIDKFARVLTSFKCISSLKHETF